MEAIEKKDGALARPLKILVPLIKDELEAGDNASIEHYRKAGEMLLEAKEQVGHGEWKGWIERNFHLSRETAGRYMRLAREAEKQNGRARPFSPPSLSSFIEPNRDTGHRASWQQPVREITSRVNVQALALERQNREKEDRLVRQLAIQLIDIGYKVLAAQLHPDKKGGSADAMRRLNEVRRILKNSI